MKIALDANIIYSNTLIKDKLPKALSEFLRTCSEKGYEIIVALTTKLEFERKQKELRLKEIAELNKAANLLSKYNLKVEEFKAEKLITEPDLIKLIRANNVAVTLVQPTIKDFRYAHKKACLHLTPHPPDIKSDEMRDLVVWSIALNIASKNNGGTLLISKDELHTHQRGDEEALKVGLVRLESIEAALEYMEVETPNGKLIKSLIDLAWNELLNKNLPLKDKPALNGIKNVKFIQGKNGPTQVSFKMKATGKENKEFLADIIIAIEDNIMTNIILENIKFDNNSLKKENIVLNIRADHLFDNDYEQRLDSLKATLNII